MRVGELRCNQLIRPLGVDDPRPLLSWVLMAIEPNQGQTAYRIEAASSRERLVQGRPDRWDSGRVTSRETLHIPYGGRPLRSRERIYWRVRAFDRQGRETDWSEPSWFEAGLLEAEDWRGQWIGHPDGGTQGGRVVPAPLFRRAFSLSGPVERARAYFSGLGYGELWVNGRKISEDVLSPGFTRYDRTVLYRTYDLAGSLRTGENVLGVILGNGFYNAHAEDVWRYHAADWRDQPKFLLQVEVTLAGGETVVWSSGPNWTTALGPIVFDGIRNGEWYDAARERPGWAEPGFDERDFVPVRVVKPPGGAMRADVMPPIRVNETIPAVRVDRRGPVYVVDFGQNVSGWVRVRVPRAAARSAVSLRYGERLDGEGRVDRRKIAEHLRSGEAQADRLELSGAAFQTYEPRFVYHGFRYVEVDGWPGALHPGAIEARVVHTALSSVGEFACSDPLLNRIQAAARWSTRTNYHSIPSDCPHREKNGWTGDVAVSLDQMLWNFDMAAALRKWLQDFEDAMRPSGQLPGIVPSSGWGYNWGSGPAWDVALFLIPWEVYRYTGEPTLLGRMYEPMRRYFHFAERMGVDDVYRFGLGDWCPPVGRGGQHECPTAVTDTGRMVEMARILADTARLLGRSEEEARFRRRHEEIRQAFLGAFVDAEEGTVISDGQTALATALYHRIVTGETAERLFARLVEQIRDRNYHLNTGIQGAKFVMHVLSRWGRDDIALAIAQQTTFPSWGYEIVNGATTLWERWDGSSSLNHHMYSDVSAWFYQGLAGMEVDPDAPGFRHTRFRPRPLGDVTWARARHRSPYGEVALAWQLSARGLAVEVSVPVNCGGTLWIPPGWSLAADATDVGVEPGVDRDGLPIVRLGSGRFEFEMRPGAPAGT